MHKVSARGIQLPLINHSVLQHEHFLRFPFRLLERFHPLPLRPASTQLRPRRRRLLSSRLRRVRWRSGRFASLSRRQICQEFGFEGLGGSFVGVFFFAFCCGVERSVVGAVVDGHVAFAHDLIHHCVPRECVFAALERLATSPRLSG